MEASDHWVSKNPIYLLELSAEEEVVGATGALPPEIVGKPLQAVVKVRPQLGPGTPDPRAGWVLGNWILPGGARGRLVRLHVTRLRARPVAVVQEVSEEAQNRTLFEALFQHHPIPMALLDLHRVAEFVTSHPDPVGYLETHPKGRAGLRKKVEPRELNSAWVRRFVDPRLVDRVIEEHFRHVVKSLLVQRGEALVFDSLGAKLVLPPSSDRCLAILMLTPPVGRARDR